MKEYTAGSKLQFCANWQKADLTEGQTDGDWADGPNFRSEITIPFNFNTVISIRVEDTQGSIREQVIQTPIYELHPDNFHLHARNLTAPFAVTVKGFGISTSTARAEQTYIAIDSVFPDFLWPEKAELTAYVNGSEILREAMSIAPSEREAQSYAASIKDTYYELTLKDGDILEVVLTVTDNLGRTERFSDCIGVKDGELERSPMEAPVISAGG